MTHPPVIALVPAATDYTEQAQVTNWPARIGLVVVMLLIIGFALWGMRRGWVNRQRRQADIPAPADHPPTDAILGDPVPGLYAGSGVHGDWMDRIAVFDLGVRSRGTLAWGSTGIWIEREGARSVWIPGEAVQGIRSDRGVAGTIRSKDGMAVVTWQLGDRVLDTGFRADAGADHAAVLDGLMAQFATGVQ
jgi:hypothetical protein